jgi:hypothetical protein
MLRPLEFGLPCLPFDGAAGENTVGWSDQIPGLHPGLIQMPPLPGFSFRGIAFIPTHSPKSRKFV